MNRYAVILFYYIEHIGLAIVSITYKDTFNASFIEFRSLISRQSSNNLTTPNLKQRKFGFLLYQNQYGVYLFVLI